MVLNAWQRSFIRNVPTLPTPEGVDEKRKRFYKYDYWRQNKEKENQLSYVEMF